MRLPDEPSTPPSKRCRTASPAASRIEDDQRASHLLSVLKSDLDCCVCWALMEDPVVVSCGHSLCLACWDKWATAGRQQPPSCPTCRAVCKQAPVVCLKLKAMIERLDPAKATARRLRRSALMERLRDNLAAPSGTLSPRGRLSCTADVAAHLSALLNVPPSTPRRRDSAPPASPFSAAPTASAAGSPAFSIQAPRASLDVYPLLPSYAHLPASPLPAGAGLLPPGSYYVCGTSRQPPPLPALAVSASSPPAPSAAAAAVPASPRRLSARAPVPFPYSAMMMLPPAGGEANSGAGGAADGSSLQRSLQAFSQSQMAGRVPLAGGAAAALVAAPPRRRPSPSSNEAQSRPSAAARVLGALPATGAPPTTAPALAFEGVAGMVVFAAASAAAPPPLPAAWRTPAADRAVREAFAGELLTSLGVDTRLATPRPHVVAAVCAAETEWYRLAPTRELYMDSFMRRQVTLRLLHSLPPAPLVAAVAAPAAVGPMEVVEEGGEDAGAVALPDRRSALLV